jgi:hypothetical protein
MGKGKGRIGAEGGVFELKVYWGKISREWVDGIRMEHNAYRRRKNGANGYSGTEWSY